MAWSDDTPFDAIALTLDQLKTRSFSV